MSHNTYKFVFMKPRTKVFVIAKKDKDKVPLQKSITAKEIKSIPIQLSPVTEKVNILVSYTSLETCKADFLEMSQEEKDTCECFETSIDDLHKFCDLTNLQMITHYEKHEDRTDVYFYQKRIGE